MKRYHHYRNSDGEKECYVVEYKEVTDPSECSFCKNLKHFIEVGHKESRLPANILNLATGSLKRHLNSGRHWKLINEYVKGE